MRKVLYLMIVIVISFASTGCDVEDFLSEIETEEDSKYSEE